MVYWNCIENEIREFMKMCNLCAKFQNAYIKNTLISSETPKTAI